MRGSGLIMKKMVSANIDGQTAAAILVHTLKEKETEKVK